MPSGYRRMDTPSKKLGQGEMILAAINHFLPEGEFSPKMLRGSLPERRRQEFQTDCLFWLLSPSELEGKQIVFVNLRLQH